jgi:3-hydroxyacyl-[acyl-carrier-protein] dehydratase
MTEVQKMADDEITPMDIYNIMEHLPHRYPFLLVDRVIDYKKGEWLKAIKNVSVNEPCFPGHFPHRPVMPGVLILEALAQATGLLAFKTKGEIPGPDSLYYFVGIDSARFKKPVEPGDQIELFVKLQKRKRDIWKFEATAKVDGKVVCSAELMCAQAEVG